MKAKEQIIKYTSQCRFSDEDWQRVLDYCRTKFGGGKIHKSQKPISNSTYQQFIDWIESTISYGVGDIIQYGNTLGILGAYTPDCVYLSAYLSLDNDLIEQKLEIFRHRIIRPTNEEKEKFLSILKSKRLTFSVSLAHCVKLYEPDNGDIVRVTTKKVQTTGIFRAKDDKNLYFYAYVDENNIIKNYTVSQTDVSISKPTKTDVERLQITLAKNCLEWSARYKELRAVAYLRAPKGKRYWYISETFTICGDIDMYTKRHDERFKNNNYFCSYGDAVYFSQKIHEIRKEMTGVK